MLNKEIKRRRRINRELRKQPAWRTCMQLIKDMHITGLKIQRNSLVGARQLEARGINTPSIDGLKKNLDETMRFKHERKHMTREAFRKELRVEQPQITMSERRWARAIISGRVDRDIEDRKQRRKQY